MELDKAYDMPYIINMTMIRETILSRMKELGLNPNRLSEMLKGEIPRQTIYDFLTGKADARSEVVSALLEALDLELKPKKKKNKFIAFEIGRKTTTVVIGKKKAGKK